MVAAVQDGAVIVGKVDGTRIWGKELGMTLDKLVWSPDCQNIIFSNREGQLFLYDSDGNQISRLELACTHDKGSSTVAGLEWCVLLSHCLALDALMAVQRILQQAAGPKCSCTVG